MQSSTTPKITTTMYKICCRNPEITAVYVGQTKDIITRRCKHKNACTRPKDKAYDYYVYQFIRANGDWANWCVIPIEQYVCENRIEAAVRERYWVEILGATLNSQVPGRSKKEHCAYYYKENIEAIKRYNMENRDAIKERIAVYTDDNREAINKRRREQRAAKKAASV